MSSKEEVTLLVVAIRLPFPDSLLYLYIAIQQWPMVWNDNTPGGVMTLRFQPKLFHAPDLSQFLTLVQRRSLNCKTLFWRDTLEDRFRSVLSVMLFIYMISAHKSTSGQDGRMQFFYIGHKWSYRL